MRLTFGKTERPKTGARRDLRAERFKEYFPRLFAYACSVTGADEAARDVTATAFSSAFAMPDMREAEFEIALFKAARDLANSGEYRLRRHNDGLTPRERDVISLVFDAQLEQAKIAELMGVGSDTVSITLAKGLRKLQEKLAPEPAGTAVLPSYS
jgi:DNA-directed RNA polymerase specialized sigma24 family protein